MTEPYPNIDPGSGQSGPEEAQRTRPSWRHRATRRPGHHAEGAPGDEPVRAPEAAAADTTARDRYAGLHVGAGFFGWMTATGLAVLMTALTAAIGRAAGAHPQTSIPDVTTASDTAAKSVGWGGVVILLIIIFLAYLGGGYAAGRMARFAGLRQGLAVWLWGVIVAVIIAVVAAIAGQEYDILGRLNDFPRIPIQTAHTRWGIVALVVLGLAALLGALLGGLAGMRYHRRVDRVSRV